jgi:hypothetical protein
MSCFHVRRIPLCYLLPHTISSQTPYSTTAFPHILCAVEPIIQTYTVDSAKVKKVKDKMALFGLFFKNAYSHFNFPLSPLESLPYALHSGCVGARRGLSGGGGALEVALLATFCLRKNLTLTLRLYQSCHRMGLLLY